MTDKRKDEMPDEIKEAIDHFEEKYIPSFSKKSKRLLKVLINAAKARQNYQDLWIAERNASHPPQPRDLSPPVPDDVAEAVIHNDEHSVTLSRADSQSLITKALQNALNLSLIEKADLIRAASTPSSISEVTLKEFMRRTQSLGFLEQGSIEKYYPNGVKIIKEPYNES